MADDVAEARALLKRGASQARRASKSLAAASEAMEKAATDLTDTVETTNHTTAAGKVAKE